MPAQLPRLEEEEFARTLRELSPEPLDEETTSRLYAHYTELRRWSPRLSLIGPGTAEEVLERHYGESLSGLSSLPPDRPGTLLDLGSGAGFPGWVLAAARPGWTVYLVEKRERKWAFLRAASRRAQLSVRCVNARVGPRVPPDVETPLDVVTLRAVSPSPEIWSAVRSMLTASGHLLWWAGEEPTFPPVFVVTDRLPLPGAARRSLWIARPR
ncbi:MAG: RsmG family class I SAM-dependent methyltransferase [Thermoanaerobaculia bacterium]|nr:RsmG family class I SAM-dependent methyltransferase [Thermoanaerobaculia bacterium]